jgi:GAF domain-containing protein
VSEARELQLAETFVALTDTLVSDYDVLDVMVMLTGRAVALLDVTDAAVLLAEVPGGQRGLTVAAATAERARLLGEYAVSIDEGPCVDCVRWGAAVICEDFHAERNRWPRFAARAHQAGFRAGHALPMRLRERSVGVLTLLHDDAHLLTGHDRALAQALADAATIGLLHQRAVIDAENVVAQLQHALHSRVIVEQAKGLIAQQGNFTPDAAFSVLRSYARARRLLLAAVCADVVARRLNLATILRPTI